MILIILFQKKIQKDVFHVFHYMKVVKHVMKMINVQNAIIIIYSNLNLEMVYVGLNKKIIIKK